MSNTQKRSYTRLLLLLLCGIGLMIFVKQTALMTVGASNTTATNTVTPSPNKVYELPIYAPNNWQTADKLPSPFADIKPLLANLGVGAMVDETLDYQGNPASRYRYHSKAEPPLYVIDSDKFFEIGWYYASAKDNDKDKQTSLAYAQKVYKVFGQVLGQASLPMMTQLLNAHAVDVPYQGLTSATCQVYECRVVFDKKEFK